MRERPLMVDSSLSESKRQNGTNTAPHGELEHGAHHAGASNVAYGSFCSSKVKQYPVTITIDILGLSKAQIPLHENAAPQGFVALFRQRG